jgi:hypothetical protein
MSFNVTDLCIVWIMSLLFPLCRPSLLLPAVYVPLMADAPTACPGTATTKCLLVHTNLQPASSSPFVHHKQTGIFLASFSSTAFLLFRNKANQLGRHGDGGESPKHMASILMFYLNDLQYFVTLTRRSWGVRSRRSGCGTTATTCPSRSASTRPCRPGSPSAGTARRRANSLPCSGATRFNASHPRLRYSTNSGGVPWI